jgi:hypothetical protein
LLVFAPLLGAFLNSGGDPMKPAAKCMAFLVAVQNGFCWKEFADNRRKQ